MNLTQSILTPHIKHTRDSQACSSHKNPSEFSCSEISFSKNKFPEASNTFYHPEPSGSIIESSELVMSKPPFRIGDRVSTVLVTSESVISRNRLQECSVHLEKLCEHSNTLLHSRVFEECIKVAEVPGLHEPVFTSRPTVAFCSRCGRDVKTRIKKLENTFFGFDLNQLFCCFASINNKQEIIHFCSRCRTELVKITL